MVLRPKTDEDFAWERAQAEFANKLSRSEQLRLTLETDQFRLIQDHIEKLGSEYAQNTERLTVALATLFLANGRAKPVLYRPDTMIVGKNDTAPFYTGSVPFTSSTLNIDLRRTALADIVRTTHGTRDKGAILKRAVPLGKTPGALSSLDKRGSASAGIVTLTPVGGVQLKSRPKEIFQACKREANPGLLRPIQLTLEAIEKKEGEVISYNELINLAQLAYNQATLIGNDVFKGINSDREKQDEEGEVIEISSTIRRNNSIQNADKITAEKQKNIRLKPGQVLFIHNGECEVRIRNSKDLTYETRAIITKGSIGERIFAGARQDVNTSFRVKPGTVYSVVDAKNLNKKEYSELIEHFTVLYLRKVQKNNEALADKDDIREWNQTFRTDALRTISGVQRSTRNEKENWAKVLEEILENTKTSIASALGIEVKAKQEAPDPDTIAPNDAERLARLRRRTPSLKIEENSDSLKKLAEIRAGRETDPDDKAPDHAKRLAEIRERTKGGNKKKNPIKTSWFKRLFR